MFPFRGFTLDYKFRHETSGDIPNASLLSITLSNNIRIQNPPDLPFLENARSETEMSNRSERGSRDWPGPHLNIGDFPERRKGGINLVGKIACSLISSSICYYMGDSCSSSLVAIVLNISYLRKNGTEWELIGGE